MVVDVQIVTLEKIIRHVNVWPSVAIDIRDRNAKAEADFRAVDPGLRAHVDEVPVIIAVQFVAAKRVAHGARVAHAEAADGSRRVVDQEQVQVAVMVEVEKHRLRRVATISQAVLGGHVLELGYAVRVVALIDEQLIGATFARLFAGVTDIDVQLAVAVHISQRDTGRPRVVVRQLRG